MAAFLAGTSFFGTVVKGNQGENRHVLLFFGWGAGVPT